MSSLSETSPTIDKVLRHGPATRRGQADILTSRNERRLWSLPVDRSYAHDAASNVEAVPRPHVEPNDTIQLVAHAAILACTASLVNTFCIQSFLSTAGPFELLASSGGMSGYLPEGRRGRQVSASQERNHTWLRSTMAKTSRLSSTT